jgi:hypothetical protein
VVNEVQVIEVEVDPSSDPSPVVDICVAAWKSASSIALEGLIHDNHSWIAFHSDDLCAFLLLSTSNLGQ